MEILVIRRTFSVVQQTRSRSDLSKHTLFNQAHFLSTPWHEYYRKRAAMRRRSLNIDTGRHVDSEFIKTINLTVASLIGV